MIKTLLLALLFLLSACTKQQEKQLIIATNVWIGYVPLFYAKERAYLDELNIKLVTTVSLAEAANIFLVSKADLLTATQHEYALLKEEVDSVVPIAFLNRSDGGDMVLSNRTVAELQKSKEMDVYLEIDSVNKEIVEDFTHKHQLSSKNMNYIDRDQSRIQNVQQDESKDIIVVTYAPNNLTLEKKSFKEVASTKDIDTIMVIDALFTSTQTLKENEKRLVELKSVIDRSIKEIMNNKEKAYELTKHYLNDLSYEEFVDALESIKWINNPTEELLERTDSIGYTRDSLL